MIRGATIRGMSDRQCVAVHAGKIAFVASDHSVPEMEAHVVIEAKGGLLLPGFVEPHIHLEKAYLLSEMEKEAESLAEAIAMTARMKENFRPADMIERAARVFREASKRGVVHMRCHAEVDPVLGLSAVEAALAVRESLGHLLDLQIVAFPQEGIMCAPGTAELMEEAMKLGVDAVGGITYQNEDTAEHLDFVFRLAERYGKPLDLHVDFSDDPKQLAIADIARRTIAAGMQGSVSAGHVTSLGAIPRMEAEQAADLIAEAGISIISLPLTDLFMNGRGERAPLHRGLTPVELLLKKGVQVAAGANNVRNPFTPFGNCDPLDTAWLLAIAARMGSARDAGTLLGMVTDNAASAIGLTNYGLRADAGADFVLLPSATEREALLDKPANRLVWKNGVMTAGEVTGGPRNRSMVPTGF
ncbi:MAG: Cytosine deaminase [Paenibacillus sp.]|nr:Cytosine deaminase [Paenibacillus sp.]